MNGRVFLHTENGEEIEITEGVQTLYDLVIGSMDWGSGFLTVEDALPVVHVAKTCGFKDWEEAQNYVDARIQSQEQYTFLNSLNRQRLLDSRGYVRIEHGHVFPSIGKCMWPRCSESNKITD